MSALQLYGARAGARPCAKGMLGFAGLRGQLGLQRRPRCAGLQRRQLQCRAEAGPEGGSSGAPAVAAQQPAAALVGEDAAVFELEKQSLASWGIFAALLAGVSALLYGVWIAPGLGLGEDFVTAVEGFSSSDPELTMLAILVVFGCVHSGLAFLRPYGEKVIGARAYRVVFALASLPLALAAVVYFINHRYDGAALWNVRGVPGVHELVWILSFISFYFLYPSTFNILEVAAVDEPKLHMWETGIMRITRHPQMVGQLIWCFAHTLWIGSSFMVVTSAGLMAYHLFGCWHGDFRLKRKYGEAFEVVKARTSTLPFQAVWEGRQQLPADYLKEFLRGPYFVLVPFCIGCYLCHPLMQRASYWLGCVYLHPEHAVISGTGMTGSPHPQWALNDLDDALLLHILSFLNPSPDWFNVAASCRRLRDLALDRRSWLVVSHTELEPVVGLPRSYRSNFRTLQEAVAASRPGDTILLLPSPQPHLACDVVVPWPLHIQGGGGGAEQTVIAARRGAATALDFRAAGRLFNLTVRSALGACVTHRRGKLSLEQVCLHAEAEGMDHLVSPIATLAASTPQPTPTAAVWAAAAQRPPDGAGPGLLSVVESRLTGGGTAIRLQGTGALSSVRVIYEDTQRLFWFSVDSAMPGTPQGLPPVLAAQPTALLAGLKRKEQELGASQDGSEGAPSKRPAVGAGPDQPGPLPGLVPSTPALPAWMRKPPFDPLALQARLQQAGAEGALGKKAQAWSRHHAAAVGLPGGQG